ncbi:MAG: hypothetical protein GY909_15700 [Oligoflexia bacterium]|nr:hypothetical protein [Oligoflexia bacterium]
MQVQIKQKLLVPLTQERKDLYKKTNCDDRMMWIETEVEGTFMYSPQTYHEPDHSEFDIEFVYEILPNGKRVDLSKSEDEYIEHFYSEIFEKADHFFRTNGEG